MSTLPLQQPGPVEARPIANPFHTLALLAIQAALAIRGIVAANQMRGAGGSSNVGVYLRTIATEWLLLGLVLVGVWFAGTPLTTVLGPRWRSAGDILRTVGIGIGFIIVQQVVLSAIANLLPQSVSRVVQSIMPRGRLEMVLWMVLSLSAGICEEAIFRGYLQRQFAAFTRSVPAGIILSAAMFGFAHSYQGLWRAVVIGIDGATLGVLAHRCGSVRPGMVGHAFKDAVAPFLMVHH